MTELYKKIENSCDAGSKKIRIETGRMGKQANGSAIVTYGGTSVFVAVVRAESDGSRDFFPLFVDYRERYSAAGKFPGGFIKREGRPTTKEILTCRLIDRPIRPLFPDGYSDEVQISALVLSSDLQNDSDVLAMIGASTALTLSDIPFLGPVGAVRVGMIDNEFVANPTHEELKSSTMDLIVAGSEDAIIMVESGAKELSEDTMLEAISYGHGVIRDVVGLQKELADECGKEKITVAVPEKTDMTAQVEEKAGAELAQAFKIAPKQERGARISAVKKALMDELNPDEDEEKAGAIASAFEALQEKVVREIMTSGNRIDGRASDEIRPIEIEVDVLEKTHGSALFTRGETQALVTAVLGTCSDSQVVDGLHEEFSETFMLHYNFPHFSVGETGPNRGPGRREIGHGALATRALKPVIPEELDFPYTIRLVSDIMESNGSSSMASVCGGTLALMDAGVPLKNPVAGVAMGLVKKSDDDFVVLTDILGDEDHYGDMDFKVTGTQHGITALQMDIKVKGITVEIMKTALAQARQGRIEILKKILQTIPEPRKEMPDNAPRIHKIKINPDKIGKVIGPGGANIRNIQDETSTEVNIDDSGEVTIAALDGEKLNKALEMIQSVTADPEVGRIYEAKVKSIKDFGAFVEFLPGQEGLVHISELADGFVESAADAVSMGEMIQVKLIGIDNQGRVKLSRKQAGKEGDG